ncbi:hypothetical protein OQA88_12661 [Cercophora sp. LCS_1]
MSKVLVFGGTGPAGICLLRELLYRNHETIAFARNPSKIPKELLGSPKLEVVQGELNDKEAISTAVQNARVVVSLLGPNERHGLDAAPFVNFYRSVFEAMRTHGVKRIFAMGTVSIPAPEDKFSIQRLLILGLVRALAASAYHLILAIGDLFVKEAEGLDWTVYRIAGIPGGSDEASWKQDREDGEIFEGYIGEPGWSASQKRARLARWLVDAVEDGKTKWIGKMPAISKLS